MSEMIQTPNGWEVKALKNIGTCKNGLTYSPDDIVENGGVLVLRSSNIQKSQIALEDNIFVREDIKINYKVQENDILVCVRNGSKDLIGKNALITKEVENMAHGAFMTVFHSKINQYVFQLFQSDLFFKQVEKNLGATINSINNSDLLLFEFPFPKEKKEQEKIAKILSTLDRTIESTNRLIEKEKNIKTALMQELLTNGIDKNGQIRTKATHTYKESELGLIPEEWEVLILDDFFKLKSGDTKPEDTSNNGIYEVYGGNGITGYSNLKNNKEETLIIGRVGEYCGSVYLVDECWITDNALYITKKIKKFDTKYMFYLLYFLNLNQYKAETGQPLLNQTIIGNIKTSCPKNLEEQKQIAKILTTQDKKIQTEETTLAKLKELKKGLMNDLLSGKVRVKV